MVEIYTLFFLFSVKLKLLQSDYLAVLCARVIVVCGEGHSQGVDQFSV